MPESSTSLESLPVVGDANFAVAVARTTRAYHNEVTEKRQANPPYTEAEIRRVDKWIAGVSYAEWFTAVRDRQTLLREVERLNAEVYRLQGPM